MNRYIDNERVGDRERKKWSVMIETENSKYDPAVNDNNPDPQHCIYFSLCIIIILLCY